MEDHWLGVWKYVLSGEWPNLKHLDSIEEGLCEEEKRVLRIISSKNCYLDIRSEASKVSVDIDSLMQLVFEKIHATPDDVDKVECVKRSPIILVLDFEVQVRPVLNSYVTMFVTVHICFVKMFVMLNSPGIILCEAFCSI